jgi:hypothetical protein
MNVDWERDLKNHSLVVGANYSKVKILKQKSISKTQTNTFFQLELLIEQVIF